MLSVTESEVVIAFSNKATNINIHNDLHNGWNVSNSLQNKDPNTYQSGGLNTNAVIQTKHLIFSALPSEQFTNLTIKTFSH